MHVPAKHALFDVPALCRFIKANPLGILTTAIKSPKCETIQSSHMPWLLDSIAEPDEDNLPVLRGHMARANPQAQAIIHELTQRPRQWPEATSSSHQLEDEVLIMFTSPAHYYITPKFFKETKPSTGKVAPTWNYSAVQAYGRATVFMDAKADETKAFLGKQLRDLSNMCETEIMGFEKPWLVDDAPVSFTDMLMKGIIGIQVEITKLEGRIKVSQDKPLGDRLGVVEGLKALQMPSLQPLIDQTQEQSDLRAEKQKT